MEVDFGLTVQNLWFIGLKIKGLGFRVQGLGPIPRMT